MDIITFAIYFILSMYFLWLSLKSRIFGIISGLLILLTGLFLVLEGIKVPMALSQSIEWVEIKENPIFLLGSVFIVLSIYIVFANAQLLVSKGK